MTQRLVALLRRQHVAQQVVLPVGRLSPAGVAGRGMAGLRGGRGEGGGGVGGKRVMVCGCEAREAEAANAGANGHRRNREWERAAVLRAHLGAAGDAAGAHGDG